MSEDTKSNSKRFVWPVLLVGGAAALGWWVLNSGPVTLPVEKERALKVVKTVSPAPGDHAVHVTAFGEVVPARQVVIEPQVTGNVVRINPEIIPGGRVQAGMELFVIDPVLTELQLREINAELTRAEANLSEASRKLEEGRSLAAEKVIADTELASLESTVRIQTADVERIKAGRERTEELFRRHRVVAPFNAVVLNEAVEIGQRVSPGDNSITLVGTDEFRVSASLPIDQLKWITPPSQGRAGARVKVVVDTGGVADAEFAGEVVQLQGDIETTGRMARLLIRVADPLRLQGDPADMPLLLGSYVRVEIDAGMLRGVLAIDRTALRDGDRIWAVGKDGLLKIRDVKVRWKANETVYIDQALAPGEALIVSDLRVALPDMEVDAQPEDVGSAESEPVPSRTDS